MKIEGKYKLLIAFLVAIPLVYGYFTANLEINKSFWPATVDLNFFNQISTTGPGDYDVYKEFLGMEKPYSGSLPWENSPDFLDQIKECGTPVVMAAFRATLPVPLESERYNIGLAAKQLAGTVVEPGETFSQNNTLGPYTEAKGYRSGPTYVGNRVITTVGGGVCKVASLLYNVATFSNLEIIMRHAHSMTVPYVPPGQDATVYYGAKDLRFLNNTDDPLVIWAERVDKELYMAFYGRQKPPQVTWHHIIKSRTNFSTEYRYNGELPQGTEKVIAPGQEGYVVKSWVTIKMPGGTIETKKKGTSWYNASPRIIERGPAKTD